MMIKDDSRIKENTEISDVQPPSQTVFLEHMTNKSIMQTNQYF